MSPPMTIRCHFDPDEFVAILATSLRVTLLPRYKAVPTPQWCCRQYKLNAFSGVRYFVCSTSVYTIGQLHTSKKLESLESGLRQFFPFSAKIYALNAKTIKTSLHQYVSICLWSLLPDCRTNSSTEPLLKPLNVLPNTLLSWNFCRDLRTFSANFFWPKGSLR